MNILSDASVTVTGQIRIYQYGFQIGISVLWENGAWGIWKNVNYKLLDSFITNRNIFYRFKISQFV